MKETNMHYTDINTKNLWNLDKSSSILDLINISEQLPEIDMRNQLICFICDILVPDKTTNCIIQVILKVISNISFQKQDVFKLVFQGF